MLEFKGNPDHLEIVKHGPDYLNTWRKNHPQIELDLSNVYLFKKGLANANLQKADLRGANLQRADLRGANLKKANLQNADLTEADLENANLSEADLENANLSIANLLRTDFSGTNLQGVYLRGGFYSVIDLQECNLKGVNLQGADLRLANLEGADLQETNLQGANLRGTRFNHANVQGANLYKANLWGADFSHTNLTGSNLRETDLSMANLSTTDLSKTDLRGAKFQEANLKKGNFSGANIQEANLQGANLQEANFSGANIQGANLQGANLQEANLQGANLRKADLRGANIQAANLQKADIQQANCQGAKLQGANFQEANLQGANLQETNYQTTYFQTLASQENVVLGEKKSFPSYPFRPFVVTSFIGANLNDASLVAAKFEAVKFQSASLQGANLYYTDLTGANLDNVSLYGAQLFLTRLIDASLINTNFVGSKRAGVNISNRSALSEAKVDNFNGFIFADELHNEADFIIRQIIFPPELLNTGVDIINYFSTVLCQKYKDRIIKVRVEQNGEKVTMIVETDKGEKEIIEDILDQYGLVTIGKKRPEDFMDDQLQVLELKNMLRAAEVKLEGKRDLLRIAEARAADLEKRVNILEHVVAKGEEERVGIEYEKKALKDQIKIIEEKQRDMEGQMAERDKILARLFIEGEQKNMVKQRKETQVLTVFILDLSGFSRLTTEERQAKVALLRGFGRPLLDIHSATLENTWGDAIIACFENPNDGLNCALKIIDHLKVENTEARIGMSIGLVDIVYNDIRRTRDIDGDCVNHAARLEPLTEPDTVLVSPELRYHPEVDKSKFQFTKKNKALKKAVGDLPADSEIEVFEVSHKD